MNDRFGTVLDSRCDCRRKLAGFTLVELIMVIVVMGVLAVYAVPRLFDKADLYSRGFHDETLAYLRYAQKAAVAKRRPVCVTFASSPDSVTLTLAASAGIYTCAANLVGPRGETPARATAGSGATFAALPTSFVFDGLGQPVNGSGVGVGPLVLHFSNAADITVEAGTGYAHE
jgi:MSHA pilin protein MshC